jgi:hypothetical protein
MDVDASCGLDAGVTEAAVGKKPIEHCHYEDS